MKSLGPKARRALSHVARGHQLHSPSLKAAWARLNTRTQRASVRVWHDAHPPEPKPERKRKRPPVRRDVGDRLEPPVDRRKHRGGIVHEPPEERDDDIIDHVITFRFSVGRRNYRRDFIVPARRNATLPQLIAQVRRELPDGARALKPFLNARHAEVIEGPRTRRRRSETR